MHFQNESSDFGAIRRTNAIHLINLSSRANAICAAMKSRGDKISVFISIIIPFNIPKKTFPNAPHRCSFKL